MPRKSLVLNGFLGGINEDGDLSDLESEDTQGGNHLAVCEDALCNQPGKIRAKRPKVVSGTSDGLSLVGSASATDDFLINGTSYYRQKGIYKIGEDIEASGDNEIRRPRQIPFGTRTSESSHVEDNSIGLDAYGVAGGTDTNYIFWGKQASLSGGVSALIGGRTSDLPGLTTLPDTHADTSNYVRWFHDINNDGTWASGSSKFMWDDCYKMASFNSTSSATIAFWDENGSDEVPQNSSWGYVGSEEAEGAPLGAGGYDNTNDTDGRNIAAADYIRFGRNEADSGGASSYDIGVGFRVGAANLDYNPLTGVSNIAPGLYTDELIITDKDIFIEIQFNADTTGGTYATGGFWSGFEKVTIIASNSLTSKMYYNPTSGVYTSDSKIWDISRDELVSYGANVTDGATTGAAGGARFKVAYDSAVHTGPTFSSSGVKEVWVILNGTSFDADAPVVADPVTQWVCRLFELSFQTADTVGWANTSTLFSQSRLTKSGETENRVESLPQKYSSTLTLQQETVMKVRLYEPNQANYEGKLYYQEADAAGNGVGALFLLANVSKSKGVKTLLSPFYTPWESVSIAGAGWDPSGGATNTITCTANASIKIGMRITSSHAHFTGDAKYPDIYIQAIAADTEDFTISTTIGGTDDAVTGETLTASGVIEYNISDPPVSETYQLSSGYSQDTETINAQWDHAAVVGRQIYVGNCVKTGDDLGMTLSGNGLPLAEHTPSIDSISYSGNATKTLTITIQASVGTYKYQLTDGNLSDAQTISTSSSAISAYQDVDNTVADAKHLKIKFPSGFAYTVGDAWTFTITKETDLILKSAIGKRYGFPNLQYIDIELPGTGITAMTASGDRLFVFSGTTLTLVNVAQDYEFLEGTFQGKGVASSKQVVEVEEGVAFVNNTGVYYFDGRQIQSISDDLMMTFDWSTATNIGYLPQEKLICVWHSTSTGLLAYSLATKAWVCNSLTNALPDTRIKFYNNIPYWLDSTTLNKLTIADTTTATVNIQTGKVSCGDLSKYKKFVKALVTCDTIKLNILYSIDGESFGYSEASVSGVKDISIGKKGKTIQFKITSDADVSGGQVSNIMLVYRDLRID